MTFYFCVRCETSLRRKNINNLRHLNVYWYICVTLFLEIKGEKKTVRLGGVEGEGGLLPQ